MSRDVGVGQLVEELEQRGDRLPFEIGAFVALEACEGLLQQAVKLEADDVRVTLEGAVIVAPSAEEAEPDEAARSLVSVLATLLVAAGPGVPPHLLQLIRESVAGKAQRDLRHLHDAIEASLIPINRGASRRVLARLVRESDRPRAPEPAAVDAHELDAELDELLRDPASRSLETETESTPPAPQGYEEPITARITMPKVPAEAAPVTESGSATGATTATVTENEVASEIATAPDSGSVVVSEERSVGMAGLVAASAESLPVSQESEESEESEEVVTATIRVRFPENEPETAEVPIGEADTSSGTLAVVDAETEPDLAPAPASTAALKSATATTRQWAASPGPEDPRESATADVPDPPQAARHSAPQPLKRRPSLAPWFLVLGAAVAVYALATTGLLDRFVRPAPPSAPVAVAVAVAQPGSIEVTVDPADSQIFVFVGRGPVVVEGLSLAGPHEFVVLDRGLEPSRGIVPKGATWATTQEGALYELAVQAHPSNAPNQSLGLGLPLTTPASVGEQGGSVRVITNPPGAKVYRFAGVGPHVDIPAASVHEGQEILVYHPEHSARRAVIGPSDWRATPGQAGETRYTAKLDVALPMLPSPGVEDAPED